MANHLDLEEQEQLDQLKHFWNEYGNLITWVAILVFGSIAAWNGWQYWQRNQAAQASALYDEVERSAQAGDTARLERAFADMKDRFGRTTWASQAGLATAQALQAKGNADGARAALEWVAGKSGDEGYQAVAHLRLASVLADKKAYDDALRQLSGSFPRPFEALAADRRGDIDSLMGKKAEARSEYEKAFKALDEGSEYRRLVEVKLTALGVDTRTLAAPAAATASQAAKQS